MANAVAEKKAKGIYWAVTLMFVVAMMSAGVTFLAGASFNVEGITHLGYPVYLLKILGTAKLLGGVAILQGRASDPEGMGLCGVYVQPTRSVRVACVFRRSLRKGPGANHHSCLGPNFLPPMEDWLDVKERARKWTHFFLPSKNPRA
jgi:hypothetical protein